MVNGNNRVHSAFGEKKSKFRVSKTRRNKSFTKYAHLIWLPRLNRRVMDISLSNSIFHVSCILTPWHGMDLWSCGGIPFRCYCGIPRNGEICGCTKVSSIFLWHFLRINFRSNSCCLAWHRVTVIIHHCTRTGPQIRSEAYKSSGIYFRP